MKDDGQSDDVQDLKVTQSDANRAATAGSIEFKQALLKRCFTKMGIGIVLLTPLMVTQAQHRFGQSGSGLLVIIFFPIATVFFVLACADYARSKGLHPAMGFLGLGSVVGLMVLSLWPDRYRYDAIAWKEIKSVRKQAKR